MTRKIQPPVQRGVDCRKCGADEWRWYNKWVCAPCNRHRWRTRPTSESNRARLRRQRYGLTEDDYARILTDQRGLCAICDEPMTGSRGPLVDHDHETGHVRGLLCQHCNTMLGAAKDQPLRLLRGADYLRLRTP